MKKILLTGLLVTAFPMLVLAQLQRHDFSMSAGLFSSNFYNAVSYDIFTDQNIDANISKNIDAQTGALYLGYRFFPKPKFSVGLFFGFERVKGPITSNQFGDGYYYNDYIAGAIEFDYRYVSKPLIQVYSGLGAGVAFNEEENQLPDLNEFDESFNFAYQVNLLGVRFGKVFGVFVELGYGYRGIVKAGFSMQL